MLQVASAGLNLPPIFAIHFLSIGKQLHVTKSPAVVGTSFSKTYINRRDNRCFSFPHIFSERHSNAWIWKNVAVF